MSALDAGKAYLQQILDKLPTPEARAQAESVFNDAAAAAAVSVLGEGVLRQQDYSRHLDQVRADQQRATDLYNQNKAWFDANQADLQSLPQLLAENDRLKAEGRTPASPAAPPSAPAHDGAVKLDDLQAIIRESLGLHAVIPTLLLAHQQRFGEVLGEDQMIGLIQQAQTSNRSLKQQYAITFAEKIAAKDAEARAAEIAKYKLEGVQEFQRANPQMPYPVRPTGSSPLDAIKSPIDPASLTPDALAAEYNALVAGKV